MNRLRFATTVFIACWLLRPALGADVRHQIHFPDLPGYRTLKCDFHMHTVFSDGLVWPTVRVTEAWRQGLDAIAITDHIEYQPHKDDLTPQHNRPYDLAVGQARAHHLLLLRSAEITRDTPPGHFNALFLNDARPLETDKFLDAVEQANAQQAFVLWNHQEWKGPEKGRWLDVHTTLYENKWLHGMEVCNGDSYYPQAHQWCLDKNLTMIGGSDIHQPDLRMKSEPEDHRTMTLAFAKERSLESLKEALQQGRTAVWHKDQVIGRKELLEPLLEGCVEVAGPHLRSKSHVYLEVRNRCDVDLKLEQRSGPGPQEIALPARTTSLVRISAGNGDEPVELDYTVTNFLIAPETGLPVSLTIPGR